jgi:tetratricopeptide (TPR) repeat protein
MIRQYRAFISYSWSDKDWAAWLHRALETFNTPRALIGKQTPLGPVPARLFPIFKDREEEAAGHGITAAIEAAMGASDFLIVLCSRRSARSTWVNREIAWFKRHRDPQRILAVVVDGEPGASLVPGREADECFPNALLYKIGDDLLPTGDAEDYPLAADARPEGDGKRGAKLKVAAAMLGVGLDDLVRRDARRRTIQRRFVTGGALTLAAVMTGLAWTAMQARDAAEVARKDAEFQRSEAEGLVEFMLTDLRKRLDAVGRLDVLESVGQRALAYYGAQDTARLDPDALGRRARSQLLVGEIDNSRGDLVSALAAYEAAAATTGEQLRRAPDNPQRMFDHSQSVFWVGYIAWQTGNTAKAEEHWRLYRKLAGDLVAKDPANRDWQRELAYAHSNLGSLHLEKGDWALARDAFTETLTIRSRLSKQTPDDTSLSLEVTDAMAWRADALRIGGDLAGAMAQRDAETSLLRDLLTREPKHADAAIRLAVSLRERGAIAFISGDAAGAMRSLTQSLDSLLSLRTLDSSNAEYALNEVMSRRELAAVHIARCATGEAVEQTRTAQAVLASVPDPDRTSRPQIIQLNLELLTLAFRAQMRATRLSPDRVADMIEAHAVHTGNAAGGRDAPLYLARAHLAHGDALILAGQRSAASVAWQSAVALVSDDALSVDPRWHTERERAQARLDRFRNNARLPERKALLQFLYDCADMN